jgi:hypothetical protein
VTSQQTEEKKMAYLSRLSIAFLISFYAASTIAQTECSVPEFGQCVSYPDFFLFSERMQSAGAAA